MTNKKVVVGRPQEERPAGSVEALVDLIEARTAELADGLDPALRPVARDLAREDVFRRSLDLNLNRGF